MPERGRRSWLLWAGLAGIALIATVVGSQAIQERRRNRPEPRSPQGSAWYRLATRCGLVLPPKYREISLRGILREALMNYYLRTLDKMARFSILAGPFSRNVVRPSLLRMMGCRIGRQVSIGDDVLVDRSFPHMITIEDRTFVASRCVLLVHQRDVTEYRKGMWIGDCQHSAKPIHIGSGVHVGMGSIICPGVTIGDGVIIGAGSVVTKDIPPYTVAAGVPAKVIREIPAPESEPI